MYPEIPLARAPLVMRDSPVVLWRSLEAPQLRRLEEWYELPGRLTCAACPLTAGLFPRDASMLE
jgi:hypothetical protein